MGQQSAGSGNVPDKTGHALPQEINRRTEYQLDVVFVAHVALLILLKAVVVALACWCHQVHDNCSFRNLVESLTHRLGH